MSFIGLDASVFKVAKTILECVVFRLSKLNEGGLNWIYILFWVIRIGLGDWFEGGPFCLPEWFPRVYRWFLSFESLLLINLLMSVTKLDLTYNSLQVSLGTRAHSFEFPYKLKIIDFVALQYLLCDILLYCSFLIIRVYNCIKNHLQWEGAMHWMNSSTHQDQSILEYNLEWLLILPVF